ncbi:MAG: carbohydrate kinase [Planctomycetota bacterium]
MSRNKSPVILGVGEILWDLLPNGRMLGGAPVNFAYHAAALGAHAHAVSAVGDDPLGREILDRLDTLGLSRQGVAVDHQHPTGTVSVELDAYGKPTYQIHEGVAWDFIPAVPATLRPAQHADAICFGSLAQRSEVSRATIRSLLGAAPEHCLRVFDINLRQHYYHTEILAAGLEAADVLKLNNEELPVVADLLALPGDEDAVLRGLLDRYDLRLIALTKGAGGSELASRHGRSVHSGVPTKVVDTVGAGDAFTAAVIMGLLEDLDLDTINERANRLASYVCSQPGAMPPTGP